MEKEITFAASLPVNAAAFTTKGDGSAKLVLEMPASELHKILPVVMMGEKLLKVTIKQE